MNKLETIRRCIRRINEEYEDKVDNLHNFTKQDSIILNLQRACESCIDLAMHVVSQKNLGLPQSSRDAFTFLNQNGIIDDSLTQSMKAMIGFRNIAVHDYQSMQIDIVKSILDKHLVDFVKFAELIQTYMTK
ncbi:type VII toxin-antitoxin system HepT family RNase toxin [Paenibacillus sp. FA6]|uniref:type VII toxin-antitoxin system HepT family RNase toxin n=1 Tax=Paenibacillus sp. FA6 TaxID=3413029 RepID=UPI003F65FEE5